MRHVRRKLERCGDCAPAGRCAHHQACVTQPDAALAAEIGAAWAVFVRGQVDVRKPWPPFSGRVAMIALRLVAGLAAEPRRSELARICHWRAGLKWEALERPRIRDRPYEAPDGQGVVYELSGALRVHFRTRRRAAAHYRDADVAPRPAQRCGRRALPDRDLLIASRLPNLKGEID